uniref:EOG090X08VB n=1 Tax=Scapholeberis mucronata TaxID=202097 RepID=A0A4Y7NM80_9CRUS|nr:EOG090X08VB [Scapholeberis mucronata]SVE93714.1 EOG090X08VB [Scapholeberis mucronata]
MASTSAALEGLPKQFVTAMKTLFEIMDDKNSGFVKLTDLESFWSDEGLSGLPKGVIESLRKVTPPNGLLSFERFCAGLKICLLRYQSDQVTCKVPQRSPSAPILDLENGSTPPPIPPPIHPRSPTATVRPNNAMLHSRTLSMPLLVANQPLSLSHPQQIALTDEEPPPIPMPIMGPPKPPRVVQPSGPQNNVITNGALMMRTRSEIATRSTASSKTLINDTKNQLPTASISERSIAKAEHGKSSLFIPKFHVKFPLILNFLQLRRIHILEQERQVLTSGLQALDRARDWFNTQLSDVQDRIKSFGKSPGGSNDYSTEAHQERLGFKISRIEEVSRQLIMLIENADRGFPAHMNLALTDRNKFSKAPDGIVEENSEEQVNRILRRLKTQNHQLTEEVGRKSERITMLEKEKSSLIRELFQVRSQTTNRIVGGHLIADDNTLFLINEQNRP